jgi:hypothetical protein
MREIHSSVSIGGLRRRRGAERGAYLVAVVVVAVGAGDEHGPPGPDGVVGRRAVGRQADGRLEAWARPRGAEARGEQQREAEAIGHHCLAWEGRERERQWSRESLANGGGRGNGRLGGSKASPTSPFIVRRRVRPGPTKWGMAGGDISYKFQTRQGTKTFFLVKIAKDLEMEDSISAAITIAHRSHFRHNNHF